MLRFIIGTAGTGKTTLLFERIAECVAQGGRAILLVPEQFSFESEKRLYRAMGPKNSLAVEVLGFTRLCDTIFRNYGGVAGKTITPVAKYLVMSTVLSELEGYLTSYKKSASNTDFLDTLLLACEEFKRGGILPEQLEKYAGLYGTGKLGDKLKDLSAIYSAYQALLERGYKDPEDDLLRASFYLENHNFFGDFTVFVDGFTTFMAGEFDFLRHAVADAKEITFAMTADKASDTQAGVGVFSPVQKAISTLVRLAEEQGVPVEQPHLLAQPLRYQSQALAHLSTEFLQPSPKVYDGDITAVELMPAGDSYEEARNIAVAIARLVREQNLRYRDIAIVARNHTDYLTPLELMLTRYNIPFFDDRQVDSETTPLPFGVFAAVDAVQRNFSGESVLFLAKTPLLGLDSKQVALLENYCYIWNIRGALWESSFINHPRGMVEETTPEDQKTLQSLNVLREQIMVPLSRLKEQISCGTGHAFAQGIYDFLLEVEAPTHLRSYAQGMPEREGDSFLEQSAQIWDTLIDILDVFGDILGEVRLGRNKLCELFRLALSALEIATIPMALDQVLVGSADRIRPWNTKAVLIIGANEGVFPPPVHSGGVFSDRERQQLIEAGLGLAPAGFEQAVLERFYAYFAVGLPSEKLVVSYAMADLQGKERLPSVIVSQLEQIFPALSPMRFSPEELLTNEEAALAGLAQHYREDTPFTAALLTYFKDNTRLLDRIEQSAQKPIHQLADTETAQQLFGTRMRLSPSRVERYHKCPYSYFVRDGLGLKKRQKVEFSPLESGSLIHYVLQIMLQRHGGRGLAGQSLDQLEAEVQAVITDYLAGRVEDLQTMPTRFRFLFGRLVGTLAQLLQQLGKEFAQSEYEPIAFELPIAVEDGVEPLLLYTPSGTPVTVEGYVDRVDVMEKGGKKYIRVVDYKSGGRDFNLADVLSGVNLQMLLYLFTLEENGVGELEGALPGGILYMPVLEQYIATQRDANPTDTRTKREKQWTMSGLLLAEEESLKGMEQELTGLFIPAKQNKDGSLSAYSAVATLEEMGILSRKVKAVIGSMAEELSRGIIPAYPIATAEYPTCSYCDYRSVCGFEEGDPTREIGKMDRREVLDHLKEEEESNG